MGSLGAQASCLPKLVVLARRSFRALLPVVRRTSATNPKHLQHVVPYLEPIQLPHRILKILYQTPIQVHTLLTPVANQVVVVFPRLNHLIPLLPVTQIHSLHVAQPNQRIQRPVNRRQPRRRLKMIPQRTMNVLRCLQLLTAPQQLKYLLRALRQFHRCFMLMAARHSTSNSTFILRVDCTGFPFNAAGLNFHLFSVASVI
jgi:hypothetical protein